MRRLCATAVLLSLLLAGPAFTQSSNARVSGTIDDATRAVLPGVTVTATNTATGVVTTVLTNEAGAYNFASLTPGVYTVSAELPGFRTRSYTDVELGNAQSLRLNFTLTVGSLNTDVEVTVAVDSLLATSSSSVGSVLSEARIQALPIVGNNVLGLLDTLPGTRMDANGVTGTFAGLGTRSVNVTRDGMESSGAARNMQAGMSTSTFMSPDLIGEMRLILAPVDAEMGRGNGQMQVFTKSGTNQFKGSAALYIRNSALDANTWGNNRAVDPITGAWKPLTKDWVNRNEYSGSLGGPIVKNKTFFFALWDGLLVSERAIQNPLVLTPCAQNGVFRYFDNWNNGNALQATQATGGTPTIAVVDGLGTPVRPATNPDGSPYTGALRYASVFGPLANTPARADCSDAQVQGNPWDAYRKAMDSTGFVKQLLGKMPLPNNYEIANSDGLNTAGYRWVRAMHGGNEGIFSFGGTGVARKQINVKLDHNLNTMHKVAGTYTYENSSGGANLMTWPDTFGGSRSRHPQHLSLTFTSTLSPAIVNEARAGMRRTGFTQWNGLNNPDTGGAGQKFFPNYAGYPVYLGLGLNQVNFQANSPLGGGNTQTFEDHTAMWQYGDTLSWTKGTHAFKFGGEIRRGASWGLDAGIGITAIPRAIGGDLATSAISATAISTTNMPGLAGTTAAGNNVRMRNLLSFLAGSLGSITQYYYMQSPTKLDAWDDYKTYAGKIRDIHGNEFSVFFKDDWKVSKSLTLNLGLRYDYLGVPYEVNGLMPLPIGGGAAAFGISGRSFNDWMSPGRRADLTVFQYVGKNSPNPNIPWYPNDWNNFGPAVGFAWQVPWFGAGKTTVRGGCQVTYQIGDGYSSIVQETSAPGSSQNVTYIGDSNANAYLDLTKLPSLIPVPVPTGPLQPIDIRERSQGLFIPDPNLVTPYAQNLTLSITRSIGSNVSLDVRYSGTLGRKQRSASNNINVPNFRSNGLKDAFDAVRSGGESALLNQMFNGINIAGAGFGPVGTTFNAVPQTAGLHMRSSSTFNANLANGNYTALATTLNTLNYANAFNPTLPLIPAGVQGAVMRYSGLFPENFIATNPQFGGVNLMTNNISNNYHSLNAQITLRPVRGISTQTTYTWSKNMGAGFPGTDGLGQVFTDPLNRRADYAVLPDTRVHDFRTNGTLALPIGPNQLLFGNSSGVVARIIEGWQLSWIANMNTGQPLSIATLANNVGVNQLYNNGTPDIVGPFDIKGGKVQFLGGPNGSYFDPASFRVVRDPQCGAVTTSQNLRTSCTLNAIADATTGQILLQNPLPGTRGTLGQRVVEGPGRWRFDAGLGKSFKLTESKSLQFRVDARNVLNHPEPNPTGLVTNINDVNFGLITGVNAKSETSFREVQAQLRFNF
ncbi:MAG: hypothetical protein DMG11_05340 [Acidobacteria bacterium]|nr:MAG: hypothetical protein DMG11_05340 [Acidobacteriota bacterium]